MPSSEQASLPIFKVAADRGTHPPATVDRSVFLVGRWGSANLSLPAPQVSKLHALVVRERRRVYVRDLASTNGVEVNGKPVREAPLRDADVVRIGAYTLRCEAGFSAEGGPADADLPASAAEGAPAAPPAELRAGKQVFPLSADRHTLLIGRRAGCDAQLDDPSIAPVHAVVFERDGRRYLFRLAGEAGKPPKLDNGQVEELKPGEELRVGGVALRYALSERAKRAASPTPAAAATGAGSAGKPAQAHGPQPDHPVESPAAPGATQDAGQEAAAEEVEEIAVDESSEDLVGDLEILPELEPIEEPATAAAEDSASPVAAADAPAPAADVMPAAARTPVAPPAPAVAPAPAAAAPPAAAASAAPTRPAEPHDGFAVVDDLAEPSDDEAAQDDLVDLAPHGPEADSDRQEEGELSDIAPLDLAPVAADVPPPLSEPQEPDVAAVFDWDAATEAEQRAFFGRPAGAPQSLDDLVATFDEDKGLVPFNAHADGLEAAATYMEDDDLMALAMPEQAGHVLGGELEDEEAGRLEVVEPNAPARPEKPATRAEKRPADEDKQVAADAKPSAEPTSGTTAVHPSAESPAAKASAAKSRAAKKPSVKKPAAKLPAAEPLTTQPPAANAESAKPPAAEPPAAEVPGAESPVGDAATAGKVAPVTASEPDILAAAATGPGAPAEPQRPRPTPVSLAGQAAKLLELAQVAGLTRAASSETTPPSPERAAPGPSWRGSSTSDRITELLSDIATKLRLLQMAWEEHLAAHAAPARSHHPADAAADAAAADEVRVAASESSS